MKKMQSKCLIYSQLLSKILGFWLLTTASVFGFDPSQQSTASMGAGGAYSSIADDESAFFLNSAGISRNSNARQIFIENHFLNKIKRWNLKAGFIDGISEPPLTFGFLFSTYNTVERKRDDYILNTSYNYENIFLIGASHRFIRFREAATTNSKWAFGLDGGILIFPTNYLAIGANFRNGYRTFDSSSEQPRVLTGGISLNSKPLRVALDLERNFSEESHELRVGAEYRWSTFSVIRAGYFTDRKGSAKGYTAGLQLRSSNAISADFGFADYLNSDLFVYSIGARIIF